MIKVFGIFPSGQFAPEIVAATSEKDAVKRAISNSSIQRHEVRDADIRELTADEIIFWCDRPVKDRELMLDALKCNHTPAGGMMRTHLILLDLNHIEAIAIALVGILTLKDQHDCWQALAWSLAGYKPSVQRDRLINEVENEMWFVNHELKNEFLASMENEIEEMEERYAA